MARERISLLAQKDVKLRDNINLRFGDGATGMLGTVSDIHARWDGSRLEFLPTADDTGEIAIGDGTTDVDFKVYMGDTGKYALFDVGAGRAKFLYTGAGGDSPIGVEIDVTAQAGTGAFRQGALNVAISRAAGQQDTTWDGNPDTAVNISARNSAANAASEGAVRGLQVSGRNSGTDINWILGANISGRNDSGKQAVQLHGMDIRVENYGNVGTEIVGLDVNLSDENANVDPHLTYGVRIRNTDQSGMPAADAPIHVSHTSTNGFDAFAHLATNDGDGAVASTTTPTGAATEALIVKIGSNLRYIPCYAVVGFGG